MINKVTLIGNLGKDPEVRHLENGASVARFSLATNENYRDKDGNWQTQTEWHTIVLWRALAERAERELKKGSMVYIEGKLKSRTYTDTNGVERSITEIDGQLLRPLDKRERNDSSFPSADDEPNNYGAIQSGAKAPYSGPSANSTQINDGAAEPNTTNIPDEMPEGDLPF